jgi:hypothetical protein
VAVKKKDNTTKEALTIDGTQGVMSSVGGNEYGDRLYFSRFLERYGESDLL